MVVVRIKSDFSRKDESEQSLGLFLGKSKDFEIAACYESKKANDRITVHGLV